MGLSGKNVKNGKINLYKNKLFFGMAGNSHCQRMECKSDMSMMKRRKIPNLVQLFHV